MNLLTMGRTGVRSPDYSSADALKKAFRALRDGTMSVADFTLVAALEGRVFTASLGSASSPATFTGYNAVRPILVVDVPLATTIIPLCIQGQIEDSAGTDNEVLAVLNNGNIGAATSTAISSSTIHSNTSDKPNTTNCSVYSLYTADGAAAVNPVEFWRWGSAFADVNTVPPRVFKWHWRDYAPVVAKGAAAIVLHASATTTQMAGFLKISWLELPTTALA